jgi:phospholipase/lecithinase/hemolysin
MLATLTLALSVLGAAQAWPWGEDLKHLVQFGDSYTDSTFYVVTNGTTWGEYLAGYAGLQLHNFALSGATCSNKSTPRLYTDIETNQLGSYYNYTSNHTLPASETLYTIWIGTNDVGAGEL